MQKAPIMPILAAVLFTAGCGGDGGGATGTGPTANVRFFNATTGMTGTGGFTTNGAFAAGSALGSGQATPTCSSLDAGATSFGFGAANAGGTGLSGSALTTLSNQSLADGGDYTVAAAGSATSPTLFLLDNKFSGTMASNQAAVRFVNLAPGTGTTPNNFVVWAGAIGSGSPVATSIAVGAPSEYRTVTSGANAFSVLQNPGHNIAMQSSPVTLQAGTVNTIAIVPSTTTTTGGYRLVILPGC
jgi:hypothetical protein